MLENNYRLTQEDLKHIKTDEETAIALIKDYAIHYSGKIHYEQLGSSCVMSVVNTVDTVIGSANYLEGYFVMPDQIHVERLVEWFVKNKVYNCDRNVLAFFMANYIKRKINELYRGINRNNDSIREFSTTLTIAGNEKARKKYKKEIQQRKEKVVKLIRIDKD